MKIFHALLILFFAAAPSLVRAQQTADDQYIAIYGEIQQGDTCQSAGQSRQALDAFVAAQTELQKFQKTYPDWDQKIVGYRLNYLAEKIAALVSILPPQTNSPPQMEMPAPQTNNIPSAAADISSQLDGLRAQLQNLQSDNATLQAKLKEALSIKPAAADSDELSKAREQIKSLMKENDLLKVTLAQIPTNSPQPNQPDNDARIGQLTAEADTLRARLAVDEAQAVPYTPEETALLNQSPPQPATNSVGEAKPISELPEGSAELVAEAQNYFAAKQFDKAGDDYTKILQRDPENALALANLAAIELEENKLAAAETHIKSALAKSPDDAYDLSVLGYVKFRQGKYDDALDALSRAAKLDPKNAEIQNYLGVTLSHKGLRSQAETALRKAIEIDPNYAAAHNNLAVIYISDQPPAPALARFEYQKALDSGQPRNPDLEKMLADKGAPVNTQ